MWLLTNILLGNDALVLKVCNGNKGLDKELRGEIRIQKFRRHWLRPRAISHGKPVELIFKDRE